MRSGKYLVAAAVLSLVVTFTLAALNTHTCTTTPNCTGGTVNIANSVCTNGKCACDSAYKEVTDTCVAKGLGDTCTANTECAGKTNSECSSAAPKTCVCSTGYTAINNDCKKGLGDTCAADGDCTAGVADSKCSTAKKCECKTGFTEINKMCKRGLGDTCAADGDCTAGVADSKCSTAKKCECKTGFTEINKMCKRDGDTSHASSNALNTHTCTTTPDCTGGTVNIAYSVCTNGKCACDSAYKEVIDTCVAKGLGDTCTANTECAGKTNSECSSVAPKTCVCSTGYTAINNDCKKGLGDTCAADGDCTAGVADSKCSTAKKCECNTGFTAINKMCKIGLGNTCNNDTSCSAVTNAECVGTPKKCACKANFKDDNGQCSTANGLQTLLSAPVALLLSFLTIVVTRLH